jgi:hypothetical protein
VGAVKPLKPGGRRPIEPGRASVSVTIRLPATQYDRLYKQASSARCSVSEHVRRLVTRRAYLES